MENTVHTWNEAGFFDVKRSNEMGGGQKPNLQFTGMPCTPPGTGGEGAWKPIKTS